MAVEVTLSDGAEREVRRLMAAQHLRLEDAVLGGLALLLAADQRRLYTPDPDDPRPDAAGRPTRFVPIDAAALAEWCGWGAASAAVTPPRAISEPPRVR